MKKQSLEELEKRKLLFGDVNNKFLNLNSKQLLKRKQRHTKLCQQIAKLKTEKLLKGI
jgi:hypothetical protein